MFRFRFSTPLATPGLLIGLALVMGALYGADQFLARLERREVGSEARRLAHSGELFLRRGDAAAAIDAFDRARLMERDNRVYQLQLAGALITDRKPARAITVLNGVLDDDSNDGRANLLMARACTAQSRFAEAESYYHRAIYGSWPPGEAAQPVQARVELVEWLTAHGDRQSLLAELIQLEQRANSDSSIARQIPALYLQAGATGQAEEAYRALIHEHPDDAAAYAGLGRVELKRSRFFAAEQQFQQALARQPGDAQIQKLEIEARRAQELDPTARRIGAQEKFSRANAILQLALDVVQTCAPNAETVQLAQKLLAAKAPRPLTDEVAEARLDRAEKIWQSRSPECHAAPEKAELLALLMHKMEQ